MQIAKIGPFTVAAAALALFSQAPALAYENAVPSISLIPLSPTHIAVSTPLPRCNSPATIDGPPYWEMPIIAEVEGIHGTTSVKIALTSSGVLSDEHVYASSGNLFLDLAALKSARWTKFVPETVNCERVAGSYLYEVDF